MPDNNWIVSADLIFKQKSICITINQKIFYSQIRLLWKQGVIPSLSGNCKSQIHNSIIRTVKFSFPRKGGTVMVKYYLPKLKFIT